jgi:hypothetical protein
MNNTFDELTKQMAQSVTRRAALKKFGLGLAGIALACFGLANKAHADGVPCQSNKDCASPQICCKSKTGNVCTFRAFCKGTIPQFP